uniref:Uncharacterized protein n=1 Tax=uncultured marine virus TaxID=186617 RepID=A0A0F7L3L9_9VIRU|nr:hypothetical protein [uncultured marine virus]
MCCSFSSPSYEFIKCPRPSQEMASSTKCPKSSIIEKIASFTPSHCFWRALIDSTKSSEYPPRVCPAIKSALNAQRDCKMYSRAASSASSSVKTE